MHMYPTKAFRTWGSDWKTNKGRTNGGTEVAAIAPGIGVVSMCGIKFQVSLLHLSERPLVMPCDGPVCHHHICTPTSFLTPICFLAWKPTVLQAELFPSPVKSREPPDPHQVKGRIISLLLKYLHLKRRISLWPYASFISLTGTLIPSPLNWETFLKTPSSATIKFTNKSNSVNRFLAQSDCHLYRRWDT